MLTVVSTIVMSVSVALWVLFSTTKDSYNYRRHYTRNGFDPDLAEEDRYPRGRSA
jgi:hypothetical protein